MKKVPPNAERVCLNKQWTSGVDSAVNLLMEGMEHKGRYLIATANLRSLILLITLRSGTNL